VNCANCGTFNDAARKFCLECGTRLAVACPTCGTANTPGAKFCGECGGSLDEAGPPAAGPAAQAATPHGQGSPVAERRLVSVLFADLVGFTTISEARDAEDVRELLDRYFGECREIIARYGGTIEKFIGDAVMAVWGTPVAQEDDAERAVRAALDLVEAVRRLGTSTDVPSLALRAGVLTGEAAVTLGAADMGMVAGDLVNTASRIQSVAEPGTVLVGESTQHAASDAVAFEPAGERTLKGKELPIAVWRAVRVIAKRRGAGRTEQLEAPFVGRDAELQLIKDFYHGTARERGVRLVSVIGQGGIGKSRLAWEFLKYIDGLAEDVYWHQGRSPAYGEGITFWALGEMVRMRLGVDEGADEESTREHVTAFLAEFVPDADERRTIEGALLQLLGVEDRQGMERGELFAAWRAFFERIADKGPVVMVFEDMQWADEGLIDFIEDFLAWSRSKPIYLITLARPELLDRRPNWGAGQRAFTSLGINPLTDGEMRQLLAGLVPGLPAAAVETIVARAEGIPLYAVETVRMLLNDGRLEQVDGGYRPVGDLTDMAVPETLHALIAARMDGLDAEERTLLQDASVIGLSFTAAALAAVSGLEADGVERHLRHLGRRELIMLDDDPRSPERGQYRFVQGLIKEVAYGTLAKRDRRSKHLAAARYFETLVDDELAGVLAQHYIEAYRAQPEGPEGAAVAAQARLALRGAATRAKGLGSPGRAFTYLELAIEVATDPAEELTLEQEAGSAAGDAGKFEAAAAHLERAIEIATQLGDDGARRISTAGLASVLVEGHQERGLELTKAALAEPGLSPDDVGYVELLGAQSVIVMRMGHHAEAVELTDRALPVAESRDMVRETIDLLITRGVSLASIGRPLEGVATLIGARDLSERHGLNGGVGRANINLGHAYAPEDPAAGYRVSRDGIDQARRLGLRWALRYLIGNACGSAVEVGDWDWALAQVAEEAGHEADPAELLTFGTMEAYILAARGEPVDDRVAELVAIASGYDDPQYGGFAVEALTAAASATGSFADVVPRLRAEVASGYPGALDQVPPTASRAALRLGDAGLAREMLTAHLQARKGRRTTADRHAIEGTLAALEGRRTDARASYLESLRMWRELDLSWPLALTALDAVYAGVLEPGERQRVAEEARAIFERLGAGPYLEQLDAALSRSPSAVTAQPSEAGARSSP
jgi:class 3 adenylate cyclase/tetratricopeptide (TPR) repeat protein